MRIVGETLNHASVAAVHETLNTEVPRTINSEASVAQPSGGVRETLNLAHVAAVQETLNTEVQATINDPVADQVRETINRVNMTIVQETLKTVVQETLNTAVHETLSKVSGTSTQAIMAQLPTAEVQRSYPLDNPPMVSQASKQQTHSDLRELL